MLNHLELLDSKECLSLAINHAEHDQHGEAIAYLKRSIELDPDDARVCYFLGAEYAQIGMIDRATESMARAAELDPGLHTAIFQLGLLHLTSAQVDEALLAWQGLDSLDEEHPLRYFRIGLEALVRNEFDTCRTALLQGMTVNSINPALNGDMQKVLDALSSSTINMPSEGANSAVEPTGNLFVSAYRNSSPD